MAPRPWILAETSWAEVRRNRYRTAVLPWGATEAHNFHLPYACDTIHAEAVAGEAARLAYERGARVIVLPAIPFGVQTGQLDIPLCINVNPSTQLALLGDIARSLAGQGIERLVVLNGHGGNDFKPIIRELKPTLALHLSLVNWYLCLDAAQYFDEPGDHAGELETAVLQHLTPDLVRPLSDAGPGRLRPFAVTAFREGWAWAPRDWTRATEDTGVGDPARASADRGEAFFRAATERIGAFFVELDATEAADLYME